MLHSVILNHSQHQVRTELNDPSANLSTGVNLVLASNSLSAPPPLPLTPPPPKPQASSLSESWCLQSKDTLGLEATAKAGLLTTQSTKDAVFRYSINFEKTNNALREGRTLPPALEQSLHDLDSFFELNQNSKSLKLTFRGLTGINPYNGHKVGDIVADKAFLSTSSSEDIALSALRLKELTQL